MIRPRRPSSNRRDDFVVTRRSRLAPNATVAVTVVTINARLAMTPATGVAVAPRPGSNANWVPTTAGTPNRVFLIARAARDGRPRLWVTVCPGSAVELATRNAVGATASRPATRSTATVSECETRVQHQTRMRLGRVAPAPTGVSGESAQRDHDGQCGCDPEREKHARQLGTQSLRASRADHSIERVVVGAVASTRANDWPARRRPTTNARPARIQSPLAIGIGGPVRASSPSRFDETKISALGNWF